MSFEDYIKDLLIKHGLFENQAQEVIELAKKDESNESFQGRWHENMAGYPSQTKAILWLSVKGSALEWIDSNCPNHWARPMFVSI